MSGWPESSTPQSTSAVRLIDAFETDNVRKLPYGMHDIVGNAMHWDHSPTLD